MHDPAAALPLLVVLSPDELRQVCVLLADAAYQAMVERYGEQAVAETLPKLVVGLALAEVTPG